MINANELRLGNWVIYGGHIVQIISINHFGQVQTRPALDGYISDYNPIPLTPEILEKAGFYQSFTSDPQEPDCSQKYQKKEFVIHRPSEKTSTLIFFAEPFYVELKHVHQLQNLYFTLIGEELDVSL